MSRLVRSPRLAGPDCGERVAIKTNRRDIMSMDEWSGADHQLVNDLGTDSVGAVDLLPQVATGRAAYLQYCALARSRS
jgi:hypothetical protein